MSEYFQQFREFFELAPNGQADARDWKHPNLLVAPGYQEFATEFAGKSFSEGLYRVHDESSGPLALASIETAFPDLAGRLTPFGFDWLGTQFALDAGRVQDGHPQVMMLEPGTGQALEVPASFGSFHNETIPFSPDAALGKSFFDEWALSDVGNLPLAFAECVGYRIPLFLGGTDSIENLEKCDVEVYWTISAQLISVTRETPEGTPIRGVKVDDD